MIRSTSVCLLLCLASPASAQDAATPEPALSPACVSDEFRQFDFWLGDWEVYGGAGFDQRQGSSRIERVSSGCALAEHWLNANGRDGHSLNVYEPAEKQWTQFWIGSDGVVLRLRGGLVDGTMLLQGELPTAAGGVQKQRIRWTRLGDGSVEQKWETSDDDGQSWQTSFIGRYVLATRD